MRSRSPVPVLKRHRPCGSLNDTYEAVRAAGSGPHSSERSSRPKLPVRTPTPVRTTSTIPEEELHPEYYTDRAPSLMSASLQGVAKEDAHREAEDMFMWPIDGNALHDFEICESLRRAANRDGHATLSFAYFKSTLAGVHANTQECIRANGPTDEWTLAIVAEPHPDIGKTPSWRDGWAMAIGPKIALDYVAKVVSRRIRDDGAKVGHVHS